MEEGSDDMAKEGLTSFVGAFDANRCDSERSCEIIVDLKDIVSDGTENTGSVVNDYSRPRRDAGQQTRTRHEAFLRSYLAAIF